MRRSAITNEWINHYEQIRGVKPAVALIEKADVIFRACDQYTEIGAKDRKAGKFAMTENAILARIRPIANFYNEKNMKRARETAELLHGFYMIGYNGESSIG